MILFFIRLDRLFFIVRKSYFCFTKITPMLDETTYRIALQYQTNYNNKLIRKLIDDCGSATRAFLDPAPFFSSLRGTRKIFPKPVITPAIFDCIRKERQWMEENDVELCFFTDHNYPERLKNCNDTPYMFYHKGKNNFNSAKMISIVGTRNATSYGRKIVRQIMEEVAPYGISVISGLAEGIDTEAHEQALFFGLPTIAVLGSGLDFIYPYSNIKLAGNIVERGGALVSEYPFRTKPDRPNFPKRNRLIAGMADAVLVIETATKGGSIITARIAHSYNRDVFAVPGSVFDTYSSGCHELIRKNMAALVTSGNDLIEMMGWDHEPVKMVQRELFTELSADEELIVDMIRQKESVSIDDINLNCTAFSPSRVAGILLGLELKGLVKCLPGKIYKLL